MHSEDLQSYVGGHSLSGFRLDWLLVARSTSRCGICVGGGGNNTSAGLPRRAGVVLKNREYQGQARSTMHTVAAGSSKQTAGKGRVANAADFGLAFRGHNSGFGARDARI